MRRSFISITVLVIVAMIGIVLYSSYFSLSSVLHEHQFSKADIIVAEGYSMDSEHVTKMLLLANKQQWGLVTATKGNYGVWNENNSSIAHEPAESQFATVPIVIMKNWGEANYSEKHIFVAYYTEHKINSEAVHPADFYLNVDYFAVNGKTLLLAHALAGKDKKSFGSDEVIAYLQSHY